MERIRKRYKRDNKRGGYEKEKERTIEKSWKSERGKNVKVTFEVIGEKNSKNLQQLYRTKTFISTKHFINSAISTLWTNY